MKNSIQKMTHKALKATGEALGGYYFDGNIYAHENRVFYLSSICRDSWRRNERIEEAKRFEPEIAELVDEIATLEADTATASQLAYSCGMYGNSGQLHRIEYTKDGQTVKVLFLYV